MFKGPLYDHASVLHDAESGIRGQDDPSSGIVDQEYEEG
jgi:hypothetical protein